MRSLTSALLWVALMIGLPTVLYAMTAIPQVEEPKTAPHNPATCAVCRHYRGSKAPRAQFNENEMELVAPGHPFVDTGSADDDE